MYVPSLSLRVLHKDQNSRLLRLFGEGSELPACERAAFVERSCPDDPELRAALFEMLELEAEGLSEIPDGPVVPLPGAARSSFAGLDAGIVPRPPELSDYTDFEHIADGGMGSVYRARQVRPIRRTVAIKVLRPGLDSSSRLARFEAERQALARMSHPCIASVYDAGVDASGRPFISMEFVDGSPIHEYCAQRGLGLDARIRLFVEVCEAVDHAHRRGVLHRDLKPSNVLVCDEGGKRIPKVIDFGIAKATDGALGEESLHTLHGGVLGTPAYMSPEQMEGSASRVDTRTDIYSLGVMLYELVTGTRPLEPEKPTEASIFAWHTLIRHAAPTVPSTRLRRAPRAGAGGPEATTWQGRVAGDLDWITMKALEKDPERRYDTARAFGQDLLRFLEHRPVLAGPPSGIYRLRKFLRRYRLQVGAAALVLLSLVGGLFGTLWFLVESKRNEAAAVQRAVEADGIRIATEAAMLSEESPNLALLLSLEASERSAHNSVKQTIHRCLPHHSEIAVLDGHDYTVRQIRFLADGRLLSRGHDSNVLLWDVAQQRILRRFGGHVGVLTDMDVDAREARLLTTGIDGVARVWELATGALVARTEAAEGELFDGEFAPDGRSFAVACEDAAARIYATESGELLAVLGEHGGRVSSLSWHPGGARLATCDNALTTYVWDCRSGALESRSAPQRVGRARQRHVPRVRFAPRGDRVVTAWDSGLRVQAESGEELAMLYGAWQPSFLEGERLFYTRRGAWGLLDLRSGAVLQEQRGAARSYLEASRDGRFALAVDAREDLCLVDLRRNVVLRRYRGKSDKRATLLDVAFHPDGKSVAATGNAVRVWSLEPEFQAREIGPVDRIRSDAIACGEDARVLVRRARGGGSVYEVWDVAAERYVTEIPADALSLGRLSPCAQKVLAVETRSEPAASAGEVSRAIVVFGLDGERRVSIPLREGEQGYFGMRGDGRVICVPRAGARRTDFFDVETGAALGHIDVSISHDWHVGGGRELLLRTNIAGTTAVVERSSGRELARMRVPGSHVARAFSPDNRYLLVAVGDKRAFVWDLEPCHRGEAPRLVSEYGNLVRANWKRAGFAGSSQLAWVICANEIHILECATGKPFSVQRLPGRVHAACTHASAAEVLTISGEARIQRWPLDPVGVAQRLAVGTLEPADLELFGIDDPPARRERERAWLRAHPSPVHYLRLARLALEDGDLGAAIACNEEAVALEPLARTDVAIYLQSLELRGRRLATEAAAGTRSRDRAAVLVALENAVRCGVTRAQLGELSSIDALRAVPGFVERCPE